MEEFLNQFLDFVDKGTDWKENNETTNSQVINRFIANNDKLVTELVDTLCEGKESSDELGDCMKPDVSGSLLTSESCLEVANRMLSAFKSADVKTFPAMVIRAETMQDYINAIRKQ